MRSKVTAGIFGILLGSLGIHKFYLGQIGIGIVFILFCWTGIPGIVGLVEGIQILCMTDAQFDLKFNGVTTIKQA